VHRLAGQLIAVEGIDQAGKWTVCERLVRELRQAGVRAELTGFPDYTTPLGEEIRRFLAGERSYPAQGRQLLFAANRWEREPDLRAWLVARRAVVLDRYVASGIAYGAAQGLDIEWMTSVERGLPVPDLTVLLDITPDVSLARKSVARDAYEERVDLLARARRAYLELARAPTWRTIDATGDRESVWTAVLDVVRAYAAGLG
jgi:dTMP kinase